MATTNNNQQDLAAKFMEEFNKGVVAPRLEGEYEVILDNFDIQPDKKGNPNYKFKMHLTSDPRIEVKHNTGDSFINSILANLRDQLGDESEVYSKADIIELALNNPFKVWIIEGSVYFYDREAYLEQHSTQETALEF